MEALVLFAMAAFGTALPLVPPEASAAVFALRSGWPPLVVGAIAAAGQCLTYSIVYFGGEKLARRWGWLHAQVLSVRERFGPRIERSAVPVTLLSGLVGVPPGLGLSVVAGSFEVSLARLLPVLFVCRLVRFAVVVAFGRELSALWARLHG